MRVGIDGVFEMTRYSTLAAGVAVMAVLAGGSAQASSWLLTYTSTNGAAPFAATLDLTASDTLNAVGGYDVTAIGGNVDGDAITGIIANPGQPFAHYSADGLFIFDNVIWPTSSPALSNPGLFFASASGAEYNLFSDNATTYELYKARPGASYLANSVGTIAFTETHPIIGGLEGVQGGVPEPAAWTLMILGFGAVGAALRQRRSRLATV